WKGWAISHRQKQKKLIMLPSETMIWQPEFTDKTLSRKPGAVQAPFNSSPDKNGESAETISDFIFRRAQRFSSMRFLRITQRPIAS
ncbi:hypothetical protein U9000_23870, partial [Escherichia coli]